MADILCYWEPSFRCWVVTVHDAEGNQIGECEYFPNREALRLAFCQ